MLSGEQGDYIIYLYDKYNHIAGNLYQSRDCVTYHRHTQVEDRFAAKIRGDTIDEPDETVILTISKEPGSASVVLGQSRATLTIKDDDPTIVSLARAQGNTGGLIEGDPEKGKVEFTVTLGRPLVAGERIDVPIMLSGLRRVDYTLTTKSGDGLNTGVSISPGPTSKSPYYSEPRTISFQGAGSQTATLEITTLENNKPDNDETLYVALRGNSYFDTDSDTNVGGGADPSETANSFNVRVFDAGVTIKESDDATSVTEQPGEGHTDSYTVVLDSRPRADVTIAVESGAPAAAMVSPATLTFTPSNWNAAQTVTVTGVHDNVDQSGNHSATITHTATSSDAVYNTISIPDVTVTVVDEDTMGVIIKESDDATSVTEEVGAGRADGYTVMLDSRPTADVTIAVESGDTGAATVSPATLTFTASNWNTEQTVRVTGVDDSRDQLSDRSVTISHSATSTDPDYNNIAVPHVTATVVDDDTAGVTIEESDGFTSVTEASGAGRTDHYTVVLATLPSASVEIKARSHAPGAATVSPATLTFTPSNWNTTQTVTVTGVDDNVDQSGNRSVTLSHSLVLGGLDYKHDYRNVTIPNVMAIVVDDDTGGQTVVNICDRPAEIEKEILNRLGKTQADCGSITPRELAGISWLETNLRPVTALKDGDLDNLTGLYALYIRGAGLSRVSSAVFDDLKSLQLLNLESNNLVSLPSEVFDNLKSLQFLNLSYNRNLTCLPSIPSSVPRPLLDKPTRDGYPACGAGVTIKQSDGATSVTEAPGEGRTDTYTLVLDTRPTGDVTITITSDRTAAVTVSPAALTFTTSNWNTGQTVTVTGVDDKVDQSDNLSVTISHSATSSDPTYGAIDISDVTAVVMDDDVRGVTVSASSLGLSISEADDGDTDGLTENVGSYTVVLESEPTGAVTVVASVPEGAPFIAAASSLTFTSSNWSSAQTVTVTGVDDDLDNRGDERQGTIRHDVSASGTDYEDETAASVVVTVTDDDGAGVTIKESDGSTSVTEKAGEGRNDTYTVVLASQPTAAVTITLESDDSGAATVSPATLTFATTNWGTAQTVTVTGVDDDVDNRNDARTVSVSHAASSSDPTYEGIDISDVTAVVIDHSAGATINQMNRGSGASSAGVTINESDDFTSVTEKSGDGRSDTYAVVLDSEPTANVTITVTSGTVGAAAVSPATLTFATTNWRMAQTVTVTGVDDQVDQSSDRSVTISHSATSSDTTYDQINITNVTAMVVDNDTASITINESGGVSVTEAAGEGRTDTYTVVLESEPTAAVTITVESGDSGAATVSPATLTFTTANWRTAQTVTVTGVDDQVDQSSDRSVTISHSATSSDAQYNNISISSVTATVVDDDPGLKLKGWHLRFGRTVSQQVVDALQDRFAAHPAAGLQLTVAGEPITSATPLEYNQGVLSKALGFETVSTAGLVEGSSFSFAPKWAEAEGGVSHLAFWGQGALSSFTGQEDEISLDGDVTTALLGADWGTERWQAGAALSQSWGRGSHQGDKSVDGEVSSTLTGLFPYGRYALTPRLGIWATAGYGWGELSFKPDGKNEYTPNTTMGMVAVGLDGVLLDGGSEGITLTTTADVLTVRTSSEEVGGLESSEGSLSRRRVGLEAIRPFPLSNGASLLPSMALGIRHDSGDAETGFGLDLGAAILWKAPGRGISGELKGRTLLTHVEEEFQEQGLALSFSWEPTPSNRGPSLSLSHAIGATPSGGMDALLRPTTMEVLDGPPSSGQQQFEAELAYGFPADNDQLTLTPALALALSPTSRNYSLLWSLTPYAEQTQGEPWQLSLEGQRQEQNGATSPVDHSLKLTFSTLF